MSNRGDCGVLFCITRRFFTFAFTLRLLYEIRSVVSKDGENVSVRTGEFDDGATFHGRRSTLVAVFQFDSVRDWLVFFFVVDNNGKGLGVIDIVADESKCFEWLYFECFEKNRLEFLIVVRMLHDGMFARPDIVDVSNLSCRRRTENSKENNAFARTAVIYPGSSCSRRIASTRLRLTMLYSEGRKTKKNNLKQKQQWRQTNQLVRFRFRFDPLPSASAGLGF